MDELQETESNGTQKYHSSAIIDYEEQQEQGEKKKFG